jgi:hypothetical protein
MEVAGYDALVIVVTLTLPGVAVGLGKRGIRGLIAKVTHWHMEETVFK